MLLPDCCLIARRPVVTGGQQRGRLGCRGVTAASKRIEDKPAVLDVVYKPPLTPLIRQAMETGCGFVMGSKMLLEQGVEQSAIWTNRRAPRADIAAALLKNMEGQEGLDVVEVGLLK